MSASQDEIPLIPPPPITPQIAPQQAPYTVSTIKLPILKKGEYDIWAIKIEHYLAHTDYPIWEVIQKGNGPRKRKKSKDYLAYGFTRRSPSKVSQYDADAEVTFIDETLNDARNKNNKISNSKVEDDKETALEVKKCLDTSSWSFIFNMFCHNQLKVQFLTTTIGDENHIRTLGDYSKPSHEGYRNTIELPIGNNVGFPKTSSNWLERLPAGSITTWEDLTTCFLAQFFSPGRRTNLCNDILMFQQHHEESLSEAWTRFKDLL
ncbi:zinc finger, CCHC-type containing protein [Tanacetum coccineum]